MATLWSAFAAVCRVNKWFADDVLPPVKGDFFFQNLTYHAKLTTTVGWNDTQASPRPFATHAFPAQGLSAMLVSPGKGPCRHHRFARALAPCHCKQWVPGRLIGLGGRSFRLKILQQNPTFVMNCENLWVLIIKYIWFVNFKCIFKKIN